MRDAVISDSIGPDDGGATAFEGDDVAQATALAKTAVKKAMRLGMAPSISTPPDRPDRRDIPPAFRVPDRACAARHGRPG